MEFGRSVNTILDVRMAQGPWLTYRVVVMLPKYS